MIDREEARRLHEALIDAMEQEQRANSNEARAAAQTVVLAADAALARANGTADLRRRRMVEAGCGLPSGARVTAAEFERIERDCIEVTPDGQVRMRQAIARHAVDTAHILTKRLGDLLAGQMLQTSKGHNGPLDGPVRTGGVDPHGGTADAIRTKIVSDAGYTVGVEFGDGAIPRPFWTRAEQVQNDLAARGRKAGHKTPDARATTIRDWCERGGLLSDLFRDARKEGRAAPRPDPSRMLKLWEPRGSSHSHVRRFK